MNPYNMPYWYTHHDLLSSEWVHCWCLLGQLKTVVVSLIFLLTCIILVLIEEVIFLIMPYHSYQALDHNLGILEVIVAFISLLAFIIGLVGYQANFIQLGLDQLFEAPSRYLGLFIHYATWAFHAGSILPTTISWLACPHFKKPITIIFSIVPLILTLILTILLLISC